MPIEAKQPLSQTFLSGTTLTRYGSGFETDLLEDAILIPAQSPTARSPAMLVPRQGKTSVVDFTGGLAAYYSRAIDRVIVVTETEIAAYTTKTWDKTTLVTLTSAPQAKPLLQENYSSCVVWVDGKVWAVDAGPVIREVSQTNLGGGQWSSMTFQGGYILASVAGSNQFVRSELAGSYFSDGINFSNLQSNDTIVCMEMLAGEVYQFCDSHTEIWYQDGANPDQPFLKQPGRYYPVGTKSLNALHLNGYIFTAGSGEDNTYGLYQWSPGQYSRVSFDALDKKIADANEVIILGSIEENRTHINVVLDGSECWSFNLDTKQWFKRNTELIDTFQVGGTYYCLDSLGIAEMSGATDRGEQITPSKTTGVIKSDELRMFHKVLELDLAGDQHGTIRLRFSDDGGRTWRNHGFSSASKAGEYNRVRFQRLGSSRSRIYQVQWSNAVLMGAFLDAEVGSK